MDKRILGRRAVLASLGGAAVALVSQRALAAGLGGIALGSGLGGMLGRASDSALDKLAQPGAFFADPAVRIALPLLGKAGGVGGLLGGLGGSAGGLLGKALDAGGKLGLTDGLVRRLNDAAGVAAGAAKPVFRSAIDKLTLADVPDIVGQKDGATQYLRKSSGDVLLGKLRPLVDSALVKVGAIKEMDKLSKNAAAAGLIGVTRQALGKSVSDQAMNGIFSYIGAEEGKLRANPIDPAASLLKGILGN